MKISDMLEFLSGYNGAPIRIMEVCGTHTSAIAKSGIRSLLSPKITLLSGPGCPVCVTPTGFIDILRDYALNRGATVLSFGDMLRVPGSCGSLSSARGEGGDVRMVLSPFDALRIARENPDREFVFATVGFETIAPVYALVVEQARDAQVSNLRLLCAVKTMPEVLKLMCRKDIHAFLAPGHVAAVCGANFFRPLADEFKKPFCVAGFTDEAVISAVYDLVIQVIRGTYEVHNLYSSVVTPAGNTQALDAIRRVFIPGDATWRGLGKVCGSGLYLKDEFSAFDAGSCDYEDASSNHACRCGDVICGRIAPAMCPLFGKVCTPDNPQGPCMVSQEGACGVWHRSNIN